MNVNFGNEWKPQFVYDDEFIELVETTMGNGWKWDGKTNPYEEINRKGWQHLVFRLMQFEIQNVSEELASLLRTYKFCEYKLNEFFTELEQAQLVEHYQQMSVCMLQRRRLYWNDNKEHFLFYCHQHLGEEWNETVGLWLSKKYYPHEEWKLVSTEEHTTIVNNNRVFDTSFWDRSVSDVLIYVLKKEEYERLYPEMYDYQHNEHQKTGFGGKLALEYGSLQYSLFIDKHDCSTLLVKKKNKKIKHNQIRVKRQDLDHIAHFRHKTSWEGCDYYYYSYTDCKMCRKCYYVCVTLAHNIIRKANEKQIDISGSGELEISHAILKSYAKQVGSDGLCGDDDCETEYRLNDE